MPTLAADSHPARATIPTAAATPSPRCIRSLIAFVIVISSPADAALEKL